MESVSNSVISLLFVVYVVLIWVVYHKIFTVYYFNLLTGLLMEFVGSIIGAVCLLGLTMYYWQGAVAILILIGIGAVCKISSSTGKTIVISIFVILSIIVGINGYSFRKDLKKEPEINKDNELNNILTSENNDAENIKDITEILQETNISDMILYLSNKDIKLNKNNSGFYTDFNNELILKEKNKLPLLNLNYYDNNKYKILGLYCGMDLSEAKKILYDNGASEIKNNELYDDYICFTYEDNIFILSKEDKINNIIIVIGNSNLESSNSFVDSNNSIIEETNTSHVDSKKQIYIDKINRISEETRENYGSTTLEIHKISNEHFKIWDDLLNEIYGILKQQLSENDMNNLQKEELQWIEYRDNKAKQDSLKYKGGTLEGIANIDSRTESTKDRCQVLVDQYMK